MASTFVLPGDTLDPESLPTANTKKVLRLGPGLRHVPPSEIAPTVAGQLQVNPRKNIVSVERTTGRDQYIPALNDRVIGTVLRSSADAYLVLLAPYSAPATLGHLAFETATRKTRPVLPAGALVYARVASAGGNKYMDPELECVSAETGRADGLGPLGFTGATGTATAGGTGAGAGAGVASGTSGMVFAVSLGMARRLLLPRSAEDGGLVVLDELEAAGLAFEMAVGRNGRVWVDGGGSGENGKERDERKAVATVAVATVVAVGRAIVETDERGLGVDEQRRLVRQLVAKMA